jgi:hypothetical protein
MAFRIFSGDTHAVVAAETHILMTVYDYLTCKVVRRFAGGTSFVTKNRIDVLSTLSTADDAAWRQTLRNHWLRCICVIGLTLCFTVRINVIGEAKSFFCETLNGGIPCEPFCWQ